MSVQGTKPQHKYNQGSRISPIKKEPNFKKGYHIWHLRSLFFKARESLRADPWANLSGQFMGFQNKFLSMFLDPKQNKRWTIYKRAGGYHNICLTTGCSWIKHACSPPPMSFGWISEESHTWEGSFQLSICICLWANKWVMSHQLGEIEMLDIRSDAGGLQIERDLKLPFVLYFMNEYNILSSFIEWQMSLFSEGTWGDLTVIFRKSSLVVLLQN